MIKIQLGLPRLSPCDALVNIAEAFHTSIENGTIIIPANLGEGVIQKKELAEGFSIVSFDMQLSQSSELEKATNLKGNKVFNLVYILTPDFFILEDADRISDKKNGDQTFVLLDSADRDLAFTMSGGHRIKLFVISVHTAWLSKEFEHAGVGFRCLLHNLIHEVQPVLNYRMANPDEYRAAKELHEHFKHGFKEPFYIKSRAMSLMSGFFNSMFVMPVEENANGFYLDKMKEVEVLLNAHISDHLPSIKDIAYKMALSESSLKRYFKNVYGTGIYEYYLHMKMEKAKSLLGESRLRVKEVAYSLGYERPSSFIRIFKKFYSLSPGSFYKTYLPR